MSPAQCRAISASIMSGKKLLCRSVGCSYGFARVPTEAYTRSFLTEHPFTSLVRTCSTSQSHKVSAHFGKSSVTRILWQRRQQEKERTLTTEDSPHDVLYSFSTDTDFRDEYTGNTGKFLVGRMFEDLDALAGNVSFDWCKGVASSNGEPLVLVTAAVDNIAMARPISTTCDVSLSGRVIWTGSSSMLVRMNVYSTPGEELLQADFVYVARDRGTGKSVKIPQLEPKTPQERQMYEHGEQKAAAKKAARGKQSGLDVKDPRIDALLREGESKEDLPALQTGVLMKNTVLENTLLTKPQDQNTAGNVFGGFLMKHCYELAFATCYAFSGRHPVFLEVDNFLFQRPVPVGSLLRLKSRVVYTEGSRCLVEVLAKVVLPQKAESFRSNKISVSFETGGELLNVLPATRSEASAHLYGQSLLASMHYEKS